MQFLKFVALDKDWFCAVVFGRVIAFWNRGIGKMKRILYVNGESGLSVAFSVYLGFFMVALGQSHNVDGFVYFGPEIAFRSTYGIFPVVCFVEDTASSHFPPVVDDALFLWLSIRFVGHGMKRCHPVGPECRTEDDIVNCVEKPDIIPSIGGSVRPTIRYLAVGQLVRVTIKVAVNVFVWKFSMPGVVDFVLPNDIAF